MKQLVLPEGARIHDRVELRGREFHYLVHVRRVVVGESLAGREGEIALILKVVEIGSDVLRLVVVEEVTSSRPQGTRLTLFAFLLKARKLDDVVRQACEAGVTEIVPVVGDHCISKVDEDGEKKVIRWNTLAKEAAQQSGNPLVCTVHPPIASRQLSDWWRDRGPLLFFHQAPLDKASLHGYLSSRPDQVGLIVGPEGGLSPAEVEVFRGEGALPVWLGPFVLRAETASIYAVAAVNTLLQESAEWTIPT